MKCLLFCALLAFLQEVCIAQVSPARTASPCSSVKIIVEPAARVPEGLSRTNGFGRACGLPSSASGANDKPVHSPLCELLGSPHRANLPAALPRRIERPPAGGQSPQTCFASQAARSLVHLHCLGRSSAPGHRCQSEIYRRHGNNSRRIIGTHLLHRSRPPPLVHPPQSSCPGTS
jgi:hypothetical protein